MRTYPFTPPLSQDRESANPAARQTTKPTWRTVAAPLSIFLGGLFNLGGLFLLWTASTFWFLGDHSITGLSDQELLFAMTWMAGSAFFGLLIPGILLIVLGLKVRRG